jgi:hypothetical protein
MNLRGRLSLGGACSWRATRESGCGPLAREQTGGFGGHRFLVLFTYHVYPERLSLHDTTREQIARHEAKHAVIARMLGICVASVSILPNNDTLGRVVWASDVPPHDDLVATLAGAAMPSERGTGRLAMVCDQEDREIARNIALALNEATGECPTAALDEAQGAALEAVTRHAHVIAAVAAELLACDEMDGSELDAAIERAQLARIRELRPWHLNPGRTMQERAATIAELELRVELAARDRELRGMGITPAKARESKRAKRVEIDHRTAAGRAAAEKFRRACVERFCDARGMTRAETVAHVEMVTTLARTGMVTR